MLVFWLYDVEYSQSRLGSAVISTFKRQRGEMPVIMDGNIDREVESDVSVKVTV